MTIIGRKHKWIVPTKADREFYNIREQQKQTAPITSPFNICKVDYCNDRVFRNESYCDKHKGGNLDE